MGGCGGVCFVALRLVRFHFRRGTWNYISRRVADSGCRVKPLPAGGSSGCPSLPTRCASLIGSVRYGIPPLKRKQGLRLFWRELVVVEVDVSGEEEAAIFGDAGAEVVAAGNVHDVGPLGGVGYLLAVAGQQDAAIGGQAGEEAVAAG